MPVEFATLAPDLLCITYRGTFADDEYERALSGMVESLERMRAEGRGLAMVSVSTPDSSMTSRQRRRTTEWLREHAELLRSACVAQAIVLPGAVQRAVLTAILWVADYPAPLRVFSSDDEAFAWARSRLERAAS